MAWLWGLINIPRTHITIAIETTTVLLPQAMLIMTNSSSEKGFSGENYSFFGRRESEIAGIHPAIF
jgi:hypothetical protein